MPLPPNLDAKVRQRFDELISEGENLSKQMQSDNRTSKARLRGSGIIRTSETNYQDGGFNEFCTKVITLIGMVLGESIRAKELQENINNKAQKSKAVQSIVGVLKGLKDDYTSGMLDSLHQMLENTIATDYMGQAEQLLNEGQSGKFDHVPASVLTGAVLEDRLRSLCTRQTPPIFTIKPNGNPKTMGTLIDDLKKSGLFNELKAKQLKAWADIRNAAAHGEFTKFNRQDVEGMIEGVKNFLVDYL